MRIYSNQLHLPSSSSLCTTVLKTTIFQEKAGFTWGWMSRASTWVASRQSIRGLLPTPLSRSDWLNANQTHDHLMAASNIINCSCFLAGEFLCYKLYWCFLPQWRKLRTSIQSPTSLSPTRPLHLHRQWSQTVLYNTRTRHNHLCIREILLLSCLRFEVDGICARSRADHVPVYQLVPSQDPNSSYLSLPRSKGNSFRNVIQHSRISEILVDADFDNVQRSIIGVEIPKFKRLLIVEHERRQISHRQRKLNQVRTQSSLDDSDEQHARKKERKC